MHIAWTFSGDDFKIGGSDAGCSDRLYDAYAKRASGIVLMHSTNNAIGELLGPAGCDAVVVCAPELAHSLMLRTTCVHIICTGGCPQALDRLIKHWKGAGYKFAKVSAGLRVCGSLTQGDDVHETGTPCVVRPLLTAPLCAVSPGPLLFTGFRVGARVLWHVSARGG